MTDTTSTTSTTPAPASPDTTASAAVTETAAPATTSQPETSPVETWDDAFRVAGMTGDPQTSEAPAPSPAPATVEPAATGDSTTAAPAKGPIPFDRHEAILQNARAKAVDEVVSRVEQQFGPAIDLQRRLAADPVGTLTQLIDEAVQHPEMGPAIVSQVARTLSARRKATQAIQPIETDIGQVYTADQVQTLLDQKMAERLAPLEQDRQARVAQDLATQEHARTVQTVQSRLSVWREQPGFTEHEAAITTHQKHLVEQGLDPWTAIGVAYAKVVQEKVVPKLKADTTQSFVRQAAQKAAASSPDPARVAPVLPGRAKSWDDAFAQAGLA